MKNNCNEECNVKLTFWFCLFNVTLLGNNCQLSVHYTGDSWLQQNKTSFTEMKIKESQPCDLGGIRRKHCLVVRALDLEFRSEAPSSSPALIAIAGFIHGSPEFKFSTSLVNSQLVCLPLVGILNPLMFNLNYLFQSLAQQVKFLCNDVFLIT